MKKTLLLAIVFACVGFSSFGQTTPVITIVHNLSGGGTDNGSTPVNFCTSQTYSAGVAAFGNSICSYSWHSGSTSLGTGPEITITVTGNISIQCLVGYDTVAFCNSPKFVESNVLTQQVYEPSIGGPGQICTSPANVSVNFLPSGTPVTWSETGPLTIVSGQGTNNMQIEEISGSGSGSGTITASMGTVCGIALGNQTETIVYGPQTPSSIHGISTGQTFAPSTEYPFSATYGNNWSVENGTIVTGQGSSLITVLTVADPSGAKIPLDIAVREEDACGTSNYYNVVGEIESGGSGPHVIIHPNPASGMITLDTRPAATTASASQATVAAGKPDAGIAAISATAIFGGSAVVIIRQIKIFDVAGRLRKLIENKAASLPLQIDVSNLSNGIYYLSITIGNSTRQEKLVIQH